MNLRGIPLSPCGGIVTNGTTFCSPSIVKCWPVFGNRHYTLCLFRMHGRDHFTSSTQGLGGRMHGVGLLTACTIRSLRERGSTRLHVNTAHYCCAFGEQRDRTKKLNMYDTCFLQRENPRCTPPPIFAAPPSTYFLPCDNNAQNKHKSRQSF